MRLMEEPVRQQAPFTINGSYISANESKRHELRCDVAEFVNRGGKIQEYDSKGDVIIPPPNISYISFGKPKSFSNGHKADSLPIHLVPTNPSRYRKSPHGQNIRKTGEYYWVQVAAIELGRGEKWTHEMAIEARDKLRMASKMPPAEY